MKQVVIDYEQHLIDAGLAESTISKYLNDVEQLLDFADEKTITKNIILDFKDFLTNELGREASTIKSKITSINKFLRFSGNSKFIIKNIKTEVKKIDNIMSQSDFDNIMIEAKNNGTARDVLMLEIFIRTGLRVSELQYFTVESLQQGHILAKNKGEIRKVPISVTLEKLAENFIENQGIESGPIIQNQAGYSLGRNYIYKRIKWLADLAKVKKNKAYPHSIRHLFAINWLKRNGARIKQLADILGHNSLDTTKKYLYIEDSIDDVRETMD
ncbi:MAG: tyrosine-type recombinase/integrase [Clostridiaceae bacterium]|nr:tyrosine-type recombinase/integrase [Clostridiaceae bacterium]